MVVVVVAAAEAEATAATAAEVDGEGDVGPPTIALAQAGDPDDPGAWSGIPAGIARGLEAAGVEVVRLGLDDPGRLERSFHRLAALRYRKLAGRTGVRPTSLARLGLLASMVRTRSLARRLRESEDEVDAFVLVGGGPAPQGERPYVIFEDATLVQVRRLHPLARELPDRGLGRRIETKRRAYARARGCCMSTPWAAASVVADYGIDPAKVHVVGLGSNVSARPAAREWWPPRFLFVGTAFELKNGPALLRTFARLRRTLPEARLDVVGKHPPLDVEGVHGHGLLPLRDQEARRRLADLFAQATCFVLPSVFDASPIASLDAAAAGLPSIVTTTGGGSFLVGEGGRTCDPGHEDALEAAMRELSDPQTARTLGGKALERSRLFTWELVGQRILRALGLPGVDTGRLANFLDS